LRSSFIAPRENWRAEVLETDSIDDDGAFHLREEIVEATAETAQLRRKTADERAYELSR